MGKGKSAAVDLCVAVGIGMAVYLLGQLLLALLVVKGSLPEARVPGMQVFLGGVGALLGGLWAVRRLPWGPVPAGAAAAAGMAAVTVLAGLLLYEQLAPAGTMALRLSMMVAGGVLAGLIAAGRGGRRRKRKAVRGGRRQK